MNEIVVAALYKFALLPDYQDWRPTLQQCCDEHGVKGSLLLAREGINGTIAGSRQGINAVLAFLKSDQRLADLEHKESFTDGNPFYRMKVKLKKEIVTMGVEDIDPTTEVGQYVNPEEWNALISDPDVVLVDTRNDYEFAIGTFKGAINPNTESFREFPAYVDRELNPEKHKKVAMFCTGGIRCEKSTALMKRKGFEEVYHLKGGILNYLEKVPADDSLWQGECFVFDNRVTVDQHLNPGHYELCHGCRKPITEEDKQSPLFIEGVCCPHCADSLSEDQKQRFLERQKQIELAKQRHESHIGVDQKIYKERKQKQKQAMREAAKKLNNG